MPHAFLSREPTSSLEATGETTDLQSPDASKVLDKPRIRTQVHGVWKVITLREPFSLKRIRWLDWEKYLTALPTLRRFIWDIYTLDPYLVLVYLAVRFWKGIEPGITVYITSNLFLSIENYLHDSRGDVKAIFMAIFMECLSIIMTSLSTSGDLWVSPRLTSRVKVFFEERQLREHLTYDVPTLLLSKKPFGTSPPAAWHTFSRLIVSLSHFLGLSTILISMFYHQQGGVMFIIICLIHPLTTLVSMSPFFNSMVVYSDNADYLRAESLRFFSAAVYREDLLLNNLASYILKEYRNARGRLGDLMTDNPLFRSENRPLIDIGQKIAGLLPVMYFAFRAVVSPASFSLTSLAILRQQSVALQVNINTIMSMLSSGVEILETIKGLYHVERPRMIDGTVRYSPPDGSAGMAFEFRDVRFEYPGTKAKESALRGVSVKVNPGQLVVIVGSNGSGKSTFIKLLTRLFDVTSGQILVDGVPIQEYQMAELRDATATLTQDNILFPVSLSENIGMGYLDHVTNMEMIEEAAKMGGASEVIKRMKDGFETTLEPVRTAYGNEIDGPILQEILDELEVTTTVSGGERQRLVASRTFMRLCSPKVRLVVVDEPSSALDPQAEFHLFDSLRQHGAGKTMIFVTHRFGHLTKHADLIICMKDGKIVESGGHEELLALKGEYANLYRIQAQAFASL